MKKSVFILITIVTLGSQGLAQTSIAGETPTQSPGASPDPEYDGKPLSQWLNNLSTWQYSRGRVINPQAKEALLHVGTNALPLLLNWIAKPISGWSSPEEDRAVEGFEMLGSVAKPAVPDLIKLIGQNQDYPERALVFIGKDAVPSLADKLLETLSETNDPFFWDSHGMAVRKTSKYFIRTRILDVLDKMGTNAEPAIPALIKTVSTNLPSFYGRIFSRNPYAVLANVGQNHPEFVIPVLLERFTNSASLGMERGLIAEAMSAFGTNQAKVFMPVLIAALSENQTNDSSRVQIGAALAVMGINQPDVLVPVYLTALTDKNNNEGIRCSIAGDLDSVAHNQPDIVVPALMAAYTNCTVEGRSSIAGLLASFGDRSRSMVPLLMADSRSHEIPINRLDWKIGLASAAKRIAPDITNTLAPLIEDLGSIEPGIQQRMARAFDDLGTNGIDAVPALLSYLTNNTTQVRCDAIGALNSIGVKSDEYIAILSKTVSDTNTFVAHAAQSTLCTLATNSQLAFNTVLKDVIGAHVDEDVQEQAKWRLLGISRKDPKFLVSSLDSPDSAVRSGALVVFYPLNQCVRESFRKLEQMSHEEPDSATRALADMVFHLQLGLQ